MDPLWRRVELDDLLAASVLRHNRIVRWRSRRYFAARYCSISCSMRTWTFLRLDRHHHTITVPQTLTGYCARLDSVDREPGAQLILAVAIGGFSETVRHTWAVPTYSFRFP